MKKKPRVPQSKRAPWRIFYEDGSVVEGRTLKEWKKAPDTGVQAVVLFTPYPKRNGGRWSPWKNVWDRRIWIGQDEYAPWGWPVKHGSLIPDEAHRQIAEKAAYAD